MKPFDIISLIIQTTLGVFLIWYTIETYRLRKQAAYQSRISIQPILDFTYDPKLPSGTFILENVGIGAALNLHLYMWLAPESKLLGLPPGQRPSIIKPNGKLQTSPLELIDSSSVKKSYPKLSQIIDGLCESKEKGGIVAIYEDVAGNIYYSSQLTDLTKPYSYLTKSFTYGRI